MTVWAKTGRWPGVKRGMVRGPGGFTDPTSLSGLVTWLDASQLSLSGGATVTSWTDMSGNNNHWEMSIAVREPAFETGIVNGLPVVRFTAANQDFLLATTDLVLTAFSIFIVQQTTGDIILMSNSATNVQVRIGRAGSNVLSLYDGGNEPISGTLATARANWSLLSYLSNGTTASFRENGVALSGSGTFAGFTLDVISGLLASSNFISGDVAEVIIYDRQLTPANLASVESYLVAKYAI